MKLQEALNKLITLHGGSIDKAANACGTQYNVLMRWKLGMAYPQRRMFARISFALSGDEVEREPPKYPRQSRKK